MLILLAFSIKYTLHKFNIIYSKKAQTFLECAYKYLDYCGFFTSAAFIITLKVVPFSAELSTDIFILFSSVIFFAIESPRPYPPCSLFLDLSTL